MSYQDRNGTVFNTPDGKAPSFAGVSVTVSTPQGPKPAVWDGSKVVK